MRTFLGIVLMVLGIPILLVGAAAAVLVGTDDSVDVLTEEVSAESSALVLPSSVVGFSGPTLVVTAEVDGADTFVGAGHPVHVASLLEGAAQTQVTGITRSRELTLRDVPAGEDGVTVPPPADLDWWQEKASGAGPQTVEVDLTEEPVSMIVTATEPTAPMSATITGAIALENLFTTAVLVGVVGLVLLVLGIMSWRSGRRRKRARKAAGQDDSWTEFQDDDANADGARWGDDAAPATDGSVTDVTPLRPYSGPSSDPYSGQPAPPYSPRPAPPAPSPQGPPYSPPPSPPQAPPSGGQGRAFRILGIAFPATALLAGGCAAIPETVESTSTALVAATDEQNDAFFARYTTTNNDANAAQDPDVVATVETGPLQAASAFGFRVEKAQGLEPTEPFTITPTALAAPTFDSYPLFYLASAVKGSEGSAHYLLTRAKATEPWKAAAVVDLTEEQPFDLVAAAGRAPAVADEAAVESSTAALELVREFAETGKAPEGLNADAAQSVADLSRLGFTADPDVEGIDSLSRTCEVGTAVDGAWITTDRGVMTIATATCTQQLRTTEGFWFTPDDDYGTIKGGTDLTSTTVTGTVPFIAEVSDDGTVVAHSGNLWLTRTDAVTR